MHIPAKSALSNTKAVFALRINRRKVEKFLVFNPPTTSLDLSSRFVVSGCSPLVEDCIALLRKRVTGRFLFLGSGLTTLVVSLDPSVVCSEGDD